jgi:Transposase DDE domain
MSIEEFIITVFCLVDDLLNELLAGQQLRQRGFQPNLTDSEVITIEVVGEFLGLDQDKKIWEYFKGHWRHLFPKIPSRTSFVRHAANLHVIKRKLQEELAERLGANDDRLHIIDGFPMPICKFARAYFSCTFRGEADYGYCAAKKECYYGFRGHLVINSNGVITAATFTAANIDEREVCPELTSGIRGLLLGDKGFIRHSLTEELCLNHLYLQTPVRENMKESRPLSFLKWMKSTRRLVETVIGQLVERFHIEKIRARDLWHQASRFWRKLLAHTVCAKINLSLGNDPLQFECLVQAS